LEVGAEHVVLNESLTGWWLPAGIGKKVEQLLPQVTIPSITHSQAAALPSLDYLA
jgi:hypothetical protein